MNTSVCLYHCNTSLGCCKEQDWFFLSFKGNPNKIPEPWLGHQLWEAPSTISTAHRKNPEASHRHFPFICQVNKHLQSLLCAGHQARCWALRGECRTQENVIKLHSRLKSYRETSSLKHPRIRWMFETYRREHNELLSLFYFSTLWIFSALSSSQVNKNVCSQNFPAVFHLVFSVALFLPTTYTYKCKHRPPFSKLQSLSINRVWINDIFYPCISRFHRSR